MNWLLILVLLVLVFNIWHGYRKGLLRIVYSLVSWIIIFVFVWGAKPYIYQYILDNTTIHEKVVAYCEEAVRQNAQERMDGELSDHSEFLTQLGVALPDSMIEKFLEKTSGAAEKILEKTSGAADEFLDTSGIYNEIAWSMADFAVEGIAAFAALVLAWILVHLIAQILGIVSHIPIIKGVNRFFGLFAGGIYGLLLVWLAFYITALCAGSETGQLVVSYIYQSPFLTFLYENNLVLTMFLKIF